MPFKISRFLCVTTKSKLKFNIPIKSNDQAVGQNKILPVCCIFFLAKLI